MNPEISQGQGHETVTRTARENTEREGRQINQAEAREQERKGNQLVRRMLVAPLSKAERSQRDADIKTNAIRNELSALLAPLPPKLEAAKEQPPLILTPDTHQAEKVADPTERTMYKAGEFIGDRLGRVVEKGVEQVRKLVDKKRSQARQTNPPLGQTIH
jgi:hypothetical protein